MPRHVGPRLETYGTQWFEKGCDVTNQILIIILFSPGEFLMLLVLLKLGEQKTLNFFFTLP